MERTKIIAVVNQKGGVGKTTTSVNLAAGLAMAGKTTLLIDSDPQGNASTGLDCSPHKLHDDLSCLYRDPETSNVNKIIRETATRNLFLLPSTTELAVTEKQLASVKRAEFFLRDIIAQSQQTYDYIIIDCPPSANYLTINALVAADSVIIPVQCEFYAMEGLSQVVSTIRTVKKSMNKGLYLEGILFTLFDKRVNLCQQVAASVRQTFKGMTFNNAIPRNVRLAECPSHGQHIFEFDALSTGAKAYAAVVQELLQKRK